MRYYDPVLSRWISTDPPISTGEYLPTGNKDRDANLPGMGGVFNPINLDAYQYGGQNPVKYVDPDGNSLTAFMIISQGLLREERKLQTDPGMSPRGSSACFYRSLQSIGEEYAGKNLSVDQINTATKKLTSQKDASGKTAVRSGDYYVRDSIAVITDALDRLGVDTSKLEITIHRDGVGYDKTKSKAFRTVRGLEHSSPDRAGDVGHFQLGDREGKFLWDPARGTRNSDKRPHIRNDYVIIRPKPD